MFRGNPKLPAGDSDMDCSDAKSSSSMTELEGPAEPVTIRGLVMLCLLLRSAEMLVRLLNSRGGVPARRINSQYKNK